MDECRGFWRIGRGENAWRNRGDLCRWLVVKGNDGECDCANGLVDGKDEGNAAKKDKIMVVANIEIHAILAQEGPINGFERISHIRFITFDEG